MAVLVESDLLKDGTLPGLDHLLAELTQLAGKLLGFRAHLRDSSQFHLKSGSFVAQGDHLVAKLLHLGADLL
jgi:hypothetical protein